MKTLGIEWNTKNDCFRLTVAKLPDLKTITKHTLTSNITKTFDIFCHISSRQKSYCNNCGSGRLTGTKLYLQTSVTSGCSGDLSSISCPASTCHATTARRGCCPAQYSCTDSAMLQCCCGLLRCRSCLPRGFKNQGCSYQNIDHPLPGVVWSPICCHESSLTSRMF